MRVLAIETSCDETAAAVVEGTVDKEQGTASVHVLSSIVASQADLHARTHGVVPEVAARAHVEAITYVVRDAMEGVGIRVQGTDTPVDVIVATTEPGLQPALVIGETTARALATAWNKPFLAIHHIAGHIAAGWLPRLEVRGERWGVGATTDKHRFPIVVLVVSGGHTQLWKFSNVQPPTSNLQLLGQTRDDAAGEAFDKIARLLNLPYPGGPELAKLAENGNARAFAFPRPMIAHPAKLKERSGDSGNLDFSFSGLKTAVLYHVRGRTLTEQERVDVAASAQEAIVDVLVSKTIDAAAKEGAREVILTGGVAANARLRERLATALGPIPLVVPDLQYCTDNAAMMGAAAVLDLKIPKMEI